MHVPTASGPPAGYRRDYYVKWKQRSYMHCTWEAEEDMAKLYRVRGEEGEGGGVGWVGTTPSQLTVTEAQMAMLYRVRGEDGGW